MKLIKRLLLILLSMSSYSLGININSNINSRMYFPSSNSFEKEVDIQNLIIRKYSDDIPYIKKKEAINKRNFNITSSADFFYRPLHLNTISLSKNIKANLRFLKEPHINIDYKNNKAYISNIDILLDIEKAKLSMSTEDYFKGEGELVLKLSKLLFFKKGYDIKLNISMALQHRLELSNEMAYISYGGKARLKIDQIVAKLPNHNPLDLYKAYYSIFNPENINNIINNGLSYDTFYNIIEKSNLTLPIKVKNFDTHVGNLKTNFNSPDNTLIAYFSAGASISPSSLESNQNQSKSSNTELQKKKNKENKKEIKKQKEREINKTAEVVDTWFHRVFQSPDKISLSFSVKNESTLYSNINYPSNVLSYLGLLSIPGGDKLSDIIILCSNTLSEGGGNSSYLHRDNTYGKPKKIVDGLNIDTSFEDNCILPSKALKAIKQVLFGSFIELTKENNENFIMGSSLYSHMNSLDVLYSNIIDNVLINQLPYVLKNEIKSIGKEIIKFKKDTANISNYIYAIKRILTYLNTDEGKKYLQLRPANINQIINEAEKYIRATITELTNKINNFDKNISNIILQKACNETIGKAGYITNYNICSNITNLFNFSSDLNIHTALDIKNKIFNLNIKNNTINLFLGYPLTSKDKLINVLFKLYTPKNIINTLKTNFSGYNITNIFRKKGFNLDIITKHLLSAGFRGKELGNALWSYSNSSIAKALYYHSKMSPKSIADFFKNKGYSAYSTITYIKNIKEFSVNNLGNALWSYSNSSIAKALYYHSKMNPKSIADFFKNKGYSAYSTINYINNIKYFSVSDLGNALGSYSDYNIAKALHNRINIKPKAIANFFKSKGKTIYETINIIKKIKNFSVNNLGNALSSFSNHSIARALYRNGINPQSISNFFKYKGISAYSTINYINNLKYFSTNQLGDIILSSYQNDKLVAKVLYSHINNLYAVAKFFQYKGVSVYSTTNIIKSVKNNLSANELGNALWSYSNSSIAKALYYYGGIKNLKSIADFFRGKNYQAATVVRYIDGIQRFSTREIGNALWSYSNIDITRALDNINRHKKSIANFFHSKGYGKSTVKYYLRSVGISTSGIYKRIRSWFGW